ncbi:MAG: hypothetical protein KTR35_05205 [Gammaproteobacteria bacterium]|nr:hypothetical protein [Gammaproteobacteria bacterium]
MIRISITAAAMAMSTMMFGCGGGSSDDSSASTSSGNEDSDRFVLFESGQVRPLALTRAGNLLLVTNTPAGALDILSTSEAGTELRYSVPVGMEPVSVALRSDDEAWVVNHLSDSVSVVDLSQTPPRVVNTLLVGDEPRDIVFAGVENRYAFVTAAHRGQNGPDDEPLDAELYTAGVGRADVWVFDADQPGETLGGDPTSVVSLFGDTARALAVSPDNRYVYVAVMNSGNKTTALGENLLNKAGPVMSVEGAVAPDTGLIVQFDGVNWKDADGNAADQSGRSFDELVPFSLPDYDVFVLEAAASPQLVGQVSGVGTNLFGMTTNPASGEVYVTNTEALNVNRFEGAGIAAGSVRGDFIRNRISVLNGTEVQAFDLNSHLDRGAASISQSQRVLSISQPMGVAVSSEGSRLYVTALGSDKLVAYDIEAFEDGALEPSHENQLLLSGGGPTGVVLDEINSRAFVMTRFNNSVITVDLQDFSELSTTALDNPEPDFIVAGRKHLYRSADASRFGDSSCASCHIFADTDGLAWDLGNPDNVVVENPNPFVNPLLSPSTPAQFHPMKGPMTTQSLRGLANAGPMHWRGDRTGAQAAQGQSIEFAAFMEFNDAFVQLLGNESEINEDDMEAFARFSLALTYPPNPIRALDNSLDEDQASGREIYFNNITTGLAFTCNDCHTLDPQQEHFGTSGLSSIEGPDISQEFKVPHLRNMYQKVGKFGNSGRFSETNEEFGDQVRGFGFMHDGNMDSLDSFFKGSVFRFDQDKSINDRMRGQVIDFVMAMDTGLAPIVGQQVTLGSNSAADTLSRVALLVQRASIDTPGPECDLIAHTVIDDQQRAFLMDRDGVFQSDIAEQSFTMNELQTLAVVQSPVTFTCVPPGSGSWMSIHRHR